MARIVKIYIAKEAGIAMHALQKATLEQGKGIVGDRYHRGLGTFSQKLAGLPDTELTLIEVEMINAFNQQQGFQYAADEFRRNLVTQGLKLNELVGKEFTIGSVRLKGIRLCEPCADLADMLGPKIIPALVHKAGLRAQIIDGGDIKSNDVVKV